MFSLESKTFRNFTSSGVCQQLMECHPRKWPPASDHFIFHKGYKFRQQLNTVQFSAPPSFTSSSGNPYRFIVTRITDLKMHRAKPFRPCEKGTHPLAASWVLNQIPWWHWPWADFWRLEGTALRVSCGLSEYHSLGLGLSPECRV